VVNFSILVGCAAGIIFSNVRKKEIESWALSIANKYKFIPPDMAILAAGLAPTIVLSASNGIINPLTKIITKFEKWDYKSQMVNQQIWRIWFGQIVNFGIFVIVNFQLATEEEVLIPQDLILFNNGDGSLNYDCREDESSMLFLQMVVTESLVKPISMIATGIGTYIVKAKILKKKNWKIEVKESEEIVWVIYH